MLNRSSFVSSRVFALTSAMVLGAFLWTGCSMFTRGGKGNSKSSKKAGAYVGAVEFVNHSGTDVCGVEVVTRDKKSKKSGFVIHTARVANGQSATLTLSQPSEEITVAACDGQGLLAYKGFKISGPKLGFYADRAAAKAAGHDYPALTANWKKTWAQQLAYMGKYTRIRGAIPKDEGKLAKAALIAFRAKAGETTRRSDGMAKPVLALVAGKHGDSAFPAYIGYSYPDGHCAVQAYWFTGSGDNVQLSRPYPLVGGMSTCAFMAWIGSHPGAIKVL